jgi:tetratricopeptide (TPR) repeat protein
VSGGLGPALGQATSDTLTDQLERWLQLGLRLLELGAVAFGLALTLLLIARVLSSLWHVGVLGRLAILPFEGGEKALIVGQLLPQRWVAIEREWKKAAKAVADERPEEVAAHLTLVEAENSTNSQEEITPGDHDSGNDGASDTPSHSAVTAGGGLGPAPRLFPVETPDEDQFEQLVEDPIEKSLPPISLGGVSFSPNVLLDFLRRISAAMARRTVRGTVHEFGETIRLSALLKLSKAAPQRVQVILPEVKSGGQVFDAIDDLAFAAAKKRVGASTTANSWRAYQASLTAYLHHLRFERRTEYDERDRAIANYTAALEIEPENPIARYNRATLLYVRYLEPDTKQAIVDFTKATEANDPKLRALALAGLAMSHCQTVHRYEYPVIPAGGLALQASQRAREIQPDLEEVAVAQGFALQVNGRYPEALEAYERTTTLPGNTNEERRLKSFALNNAGWVRMEILQDFDAAEDEFKRALKLWPQNKMSFANLGELCRKRRDLDRAVEMYMQALELDPNYVNGANELGMIYLDKAGAEPSNSEKWLELADSWHKRAVSLVPGEATRQAASLHGRFADHCESAGFGSRAVRERQVGGCSAKSGSMSPDASEPESPQRIDQVLVDLPAPPAGTPAQASAEPTSPVQPASPGG